MPWVSFGKGKFYVAGKHDLAHVLSWESIQTITCNLVKKLFDSKDTKQDTDNLKSLVNLIFKVDNEAKIYTTYDGKDYKTKDLDPTNNGYILHSGT